MQEKKKKTEKKHTGEEHDNDDKKKRKQKTKHEISAMPYRRTWERVYRELRLVGRHVLFVPREHALAIVPVVLAGVRVNFANGLQQGPENVLGDTQVSHFGLICVPDEGYKETTRKKTISINYFYNSINLLHVLCDLRK